MCECDECTGGVIEDAFTAEEMALNAETRAEQAVTQDDRETWLRIANDWWMKAPVSNAREVASMLRVTLSHYRDEDGRDMHTVQERTAETGLYYGFTDKAAYDAVQRDKAASAWICGGR